LDAQHAIETKTSPSKQKSKPVKRNTLAETKATVPE
jgi:hypothetical protein